MSTVDTQDQPTGAIGSGEARRWPKWVSKELERVDPLVVDGVGTATNAETDHVVLILTADEKEVRVFEIPKSLTGRMVEMLSRLL